jgi:hypothetical protein
MMSGMVKVFNKGTRPIVWRSTPHRGREVIHPGKYDVFGAEKAAEIIRKFDDAVSEADFYGAKNRTDKPTPAKGKDTSRKE